MKRYRPDFRYQNTTESYSATEVDNLLAGYYTQAQVDSLLDNYYTKAEVDALLAALSGSAPSLELLFDGPDGSTTFTDTSSAARAITPVGNVQIDTAQFLSGSSSALFDGAGDYLSLINEASLLNPLGDWTITVPVRPASLGTALTLINTRPDGGAAGLSLLLLATGKLSVYGWNSAGTMWDSGGDGSQTLALNTWATVEISHSLSTKTLSTRVDGTPDDSVTYVGDLSLGDSVMWIGAQDRAAGQLPFHGHMDRVDITTN